MWGGRDDEGKKEGNLSIHEDHMSNYNYVIVCHFEFCTAEMENDDTNTHKNGASSNKNITVTSYDCYKLEISESALSP